ncbi:MAG: hypothetical protein K2V38_20890, partial [Gemmataceae bacterium]|nr:hypothetical protein [Gemmataceae bacterium]
MIARGVRFSVGVVGLSEHLDEIRALRAELPPEVYLWVNAYKRGRGQTHPPAPSLQGGGVRLLGEATAVLTPEANSPLPAGRGVGGVGLPADPADLTRVDPLFPFNNEYHPSRGESCRAGASVISVDGDGTVRRCHFIKEPIGSIYDAGFEACLRERPCTNDTCGCHIGYVHLDRLKLYDTFGDGVLERIPLGYR